MKDRLVVNYATGGFVHGQRRLVATCKSIGLEVECYGARDKFSPHEEAPYFFKYEAILAASKKASVLLWADATVYASGAKSADPIFEHIEREGYYLQNQGWNNAQWCNDRSLAAFGFTRDEAETQCQVLGGFFGISLDHSMGRMILDKVIAHKHLFPGGWNNNSKTESEDLRCLGHRHDQSVLSLIAAEHHLKTPVCEDNGWCCYRDDDPAFVFNIGRNW